MIQVVPDPVRDERINVGVVAWDAERGRGAVKFSRSRQRLHAIGVDDTAFVSEFQSWLSALIPRSRRRRSMQLKLVDDGRETWSLETMQSAASEWGGMIRLSEPRAARGSDVAALADSVYNRSVFVHRANVDPDSGRQAIRRSAASLVRSALNERFGEEPPLDTSVSYDLQGRVSSHQFDVVMTNGTARGALITPNFQDKRTEQIRRDLDAAAWAIEDVRSGIGDIEFGILRASTMRPTLLSRLDAIASALEVRALEREELGQWAIDEVAAKVSQRA